MFPRKKRRKKASPNAHEKKTAKIIILLCFFSSSLRNLPINLKLKKVFFKQRKKFDLYILYCFVMLVLWTYKSKNKYNAVINNIIIHDF